MEIRIILLYTKELSRTIINVYEITLPDKISNFKKPVDGLPVVNLQ
jgi:hypothetical protein